jgi:membrane protein involved in colicin uptake
VAKAIQSAKNAERRRIAKQMTNEAIRKAKNAAEAEAARLKAEANAAAKAKANANAAEAARIKAEANAAAAEAARLKAEANAKTARNAKERNNAAKKIQAAFRESQAKKAAVEAARKAANNAKAAALKAKANANAAAVARAERAAKARAAVTRAVAISKLTAAPLTGRRAALGGQMEIKKSLEQFFKNFQLTGASPTNVLKKTTKETSITNASKFLSKSMLIPVRGTVYPNKLNWERAVNSLDQYDLTNAQKNLIRRVNIAIAAKPKKGRFEIRPLVKVPLSGNRSKNIAAQVNAIKKQKEAEERAARQQNNANRRSRRAGGSTQPAFKPTGSRATYGMF